MASAVTGGIGMVLHRQISRRDVLRAVLVSGAALAVPSLALAEQCRETPRQDEGPFYLNGFDRTRPVVHNNDLTVVPGATGKPDGEIIQVTGRVVDEECRPVKGAMVEIWQANARGRYTHVADPNPAPKEPNFPGFGEATTAAEGKYSFKPMPTRIGHSIVTYRSRHGIERQACRNAGKIANF